MDESMDFEDAVMPHLHSTGIIIDLGSEELAPIKKPNAEQIVLRQIEQERRRRQAFAARIDLNMQSDIMTEFEMSMHN